jgi:hypothetical protein
MLFLDPVLAHCSRSLRNQDALLAFAQYHLPDSFLMLRRLEDGPEYSIPERCTL